jgi:DNA-binding PadR family transcriptional regulator
MRTIEEERGYRPSPGSVYPALQMLEEGDFLTGQDIDGKRVYTITDKGSELLAKHRESMPEDERPGPGGPPRGLHLFARGVQTIVGLKLVLKEIARTRDPEKYAQALAIVERARRDLYSLLTHE